jgi:hypothetical protein
LRQVVSLPASQNKANRRTNRLGYYTFTELAVGETYIFNVFSKRYQFNTQVVSLTEDLSELDFSAQ